MNIEVRLFATLAAFLPPASREGAAIVDVPEGSTVDDVARRLGIPGDMARVALVNGREAGPEQLLAEHDIVALFPPLAGGRGRDAAGSSGTLKRLSWCNRPPGSV